MSEEGREIGLDGLTWIEEGLLDYIAPNEYKRFVMDLPNEEYIQAAKGTGTQVYACLENWPRPVTPP